MIDTWHIYEDEGVFRHSSWIEDTDGYINELYPNLHMCFIRAEHNYRINFKVILF